MLGTHLQVTSRIPGGLLFQPPHGALHTTHSRPILQTCMKSPAGFGLEGLRRGGVFQGILHPAGHSGLSYVLEPGPATVSLALPGSWEGPAPGTPGLAGGWWLDFGLPSPL